MPQEIQIQPLQHGYFNRTDLQKNKTYILLFAVVVVWGMILYKLLFSSQSTAVSLPPEKFLEPPVFVKKEFLPKFEIKANYRDPFLGVSRSKPRKKKVSKQRIPQPKVIFPKIEYLGVIKGADRFKFILGISNKHYFYSTKDTFQGVQLLSGSKKEVTIMYQSKKKTYPFQEKRPLH